MAADHLDLVWQTDLLNFWKTSKLIKFHTLNTSNLSRVVLQENKMVKATQAFSRHTSKVIQFVEQDFQQKLRSVIFK